ncbi:M15 family metallopeptidase [Microbulbifer sp. JMSA008]|uniref:M15 family metallopeptidase n=1 Tax=Microbulbifer sp. JMSA008 TaxID=3243373 RepID=UPI004038FF6C
MSHYIIFALIVFVLIACGKDSLRDITEQDFQPGAETGIFNVSQSECELMMYRKITTKESPVGCERLKKVVFDFYPLPEDSDIASALNSEHGLKNKNDTNRQKGAIIVLDVVADNVLALFGELYQRQFPIKSAIPIEYFSKKERKTEDMNNSLAFDSRPITDGSKWSEHAYGVAIDINPMQNPYLYIDKSSKPILIPKNTKEGYLNRAKYRAGKPVRAGMSEDVTSLFAMYGFAVWGGDWDVPIDYMHFQVGSRQFIEHLVALPIEQARLLFENYTSQLRQCFEHGKSISDVNFLRKYCVDKVSAAFEPRQDKVKGTSNI